jgi:hypothetical protein
MRPHAIFAAGALLAAACKAPAASTASPCDARADHPSRLSCTGLYADLRSGALAAGVEPYAPGIGSYSDGADKSRWIRLPAGTAIDGSDPDEWTFPVGTQFWKEFRVAGQRVETRFLRKNASGWLRTTYRWAPDGSDAFELTVGAQDVLGTRYEIASSTECAMCHDGRRDTVLGFEAVALAAPGATGLTYDRLVSEGLLTGAPSARPTIPGDADAVAALSWLHVNCGVSCHNASDGSLAGDTGLLMRLAASATTVEATDTYQTAVGVASHFQPAGESGWLRITAGDAAHSVIPYRDSQRDNAAAMPPVAIHTVDEPGLADVRTWIDELGAKESSGDGGQAGAPGPVDAGLADADGPADLAGPASDGATRDALDAGVDASPTDAGHRHPPNHGAGH